MAILLIMTGCFSQKDFIAEYDFNYSANFKKYKTFSVYDLKQTGSVNPANAEKIVQALKKQMQN